MSSSAYVCCFVCLIFPIFTSTFELFSSSSFSSSSSRSGKEIHHNTETIVENGKEVHFCSYKGMKYLPGSNFTDLEDCMKCRCTEQWFSCYSLEAKFNTRSQSNGSDAECVALKIGCATEWVLKMNHSINCPEQDQGNMTDYLPDNMTDYMPNFVPDLKAIKDLFSFF